MSFSLFFFHTPTTTDIYTLSLHDALPISDAFNRKFGNDYAQVATVARPSGKKPELRRTGEDGQFANSRERLICDLRVCLLVSRCNPAFSHLQIAEGKRFTIIFAQDCRFACLQI